MNADKLCLPTSTRQRCDRHTMREDVSTGSYKGQWEWWHHVISIWNYVREVCDLICVYCQQETLLYLMWMRHLILLFRYLESAMATPCSLHSITIMLPRSYRWKKMSKAMNNSLHELQFFWECEPVIYAESNDFLTSPTVSKYNFIGVEQFECCFILW